MANKKQKKNDDSQKPFDVLEEYGLTLEQEMFCQYFTSSTEFFGNGVQSYASAYNFDITNGREYNSAKSAASRLLTNVNVLRRVNDLIEASGLNDANVDKQLFMLITQSSDFHAKLGAIKEYNKLKQRITDKVQHEVIAPITTIEIFPAKPKQENDTSDTNNEGAESEVEGS